VHVTPSGYLAPEYATLGIVSEKVDVYSFGVVLLEIVSGRKNIDNKMLVDQVYLCMWVRTYQQTSHFETFMSMTFVPKKWSFIIFHIVEYFGDLTTITHWSCFYIFNSYVI